MNTEPALQASHAPEAANDAPDVLPPPINTLMATLWVVLFAGRWLIVPLLQYGGLLSAEQTADWDEGSLAKLYLILLSITCIVLALRAVRSIQQPSVRVNAAIPPGNKARHEDVEA